MLMPEMAPGTLLVTVYANVICWPGAVNALAVLVWTVTCGSVAAWAWPVPMRLLQG